MEPVRVGLIGCGVIGRHHARVASESPLVRVVAVYESYVAPDSDAETHVAAMVVCESGSVAL